MFNLNGSLIKLKRNTSLPLMERTKEGYEKMHPLYLSFQCCDNDSKNDHSHVLMRYDMSARGKSLKESVKPGAANIFTEFPKGITLQKLRS